MRLSYQPKSQTGSATVKRVAHASAFSELECAKKQVLHAKDSWTNQHGIFCLLSLMLQADNYEGTVSSFLSSHLIYWSLHFSITFFNYLPLLSGVRSYLMPVIIIVKQTNKINVVNSQCKAMIFSCFSGVPFEKNGKAPPLWFGLSACLYVCSFVFHRVWKSVLTRCGERETVEWK